MTYKEQYDQQTHEMYERASHWRQSEAWRAAGGARRLRVHRSRCSLGRRCHVRGGDRLPQLGAGPRAGVRLDRMA